MSHTYQARNTAFIYNSDLSGDVEIVTKNGQRLSVLGDDLLAFVSDYVKNYKMAELGDMDPLDVLQIKRR